MLLLILKWYSVCVFLWRAYVVLCLLFFFFLMIRRPPRSTLFPYHDALPISATPRAPSRTPSSVRRSAESRGVWTIVAVRQSPRMIVTPSRAAPLNASPSTSTGSQRARRAPSAAATRSTAGPERRIDASVEPRASTPPKVTEHLSPGRVCPPP